MCAPVHVLGLSLLLTVELRTLNITSFSYSFTSWWDRLTRVAWSACHPFPMQMARADLNWTSLFPQIRYTLITFFPRQTHLPPSFSQVSAAISVSLQNSHPILLCSGFFSIELCIISLCNIFVLLHPTVRMRATPE